MKHSALSSLSVLSLLIGTLTLVGCGGAFTMSDPGVGTESSKVAGPAIQGSVYGGHAPIQGAHVYLLQPGITGYGSVATSVLGNNGATSVGAYTISTDASDPNVTVGAQYETTDSTGSFDLTGAYNCVVGQPVYIYAYGGNIGSTSSTGTSNVAYTISSITVTGATGGGGGTATYTFTVNSTAAVAAGTSVTIAGLYGGNGAGGDDWSILDGAQAVVATPAPGTTTFSITATDRFHYGIFNTAGNITNGTYGTTGTNRIGAGGTATEPITTTTTNGAVNNNSIVQLATLGNCPSSGNFSSGTTALTYVYLNEVSTVATAYTFQPFTTTANNDAFHIGTPNPATNALAGLGIANAATTAGTLYNIQGSSTNISSSGDGEGHLANTQTIAGNGIVPQATIDSLANILANCVDSVPSAVGTVTSQCSSLFNIATQNGAVGGTAPIDTATAALYIARYPAGNSSLAAVDATYASDLYTLQNGTVPYVPDLQHAPHDWTLAINYPVSSTAYFTVANPAFGLAESVEVDGNGDVWVTGQTNDAIVRLNSQGVIYPATAANNLGYIPGYVSVDGSNNAWTGNANSSSPIFEAGSNGVFTATYGTANQFIHAYVNIADNAGNDYFFAGTSGTGTNFQMFKYPVGSTSATTPTMYSISPSTITAGDQVAHGAIDAGGNFWLTTETSYQIAKVSNTGTKIWSTAVNQSPEFVAIDNTGNGWVPGYNANSIYKLNSAGAITTLTSGSTGGALVYPFGAAVDGNGNVWVTSRCGPQNVCGTYTNSRTLIEINGTGTNGTVNNAISPPTNFVPQAQYPATATSFTNILTDPLNLAIDPSGNIWVTNYNSGGISSVTEIVGTAAPVMTPLSAAAAATPTNKLGAKP